MLDAKAAEMVQYLFAHRGRLLGMAFLNATLIPLLCRKAGVPEADTRGKLTSHRARSTIASMLGNAKEPMTLLELQQWLGHRWPSSTQHYFQILPTKLGRAYADADYFRRNVRTVDVLIDEQTILSGAAANGEPWKYFDWGMAYVPIRSMSSARTGWRAHAARSIGPSRQRSRRTRRRLPTCGR